MSNIIKKTSTFFGILLFVLLLLMIAFALPNMRLSAQKQEKEQQVAETFQVVKAVISGTVFYPDSTKVAGGALIFFTKEDSSVSPSNERKPLAGSGSDGRFSKEIAPGFYRVCAWKPSENYLLPDGLPFGLPIGGKCVGVEISAGENKEISLMLAKQSGLLEGKITNWENLFLPPETQVVLYRPLKLVKGKWTLTSFEEATWDAKAEVKPDENGNFVINGLPEGTYFLRIETPGLEAKYYKTKNTKGEASPIEIKNGVKNKISFKLP
jgi:hypothetical protein